MDSVISALNRRDFLKSTGAVGLFVFFSFHGRLAEAGPRKAWSRHPLPEDFNAYLHVAADGHVTCFTGKIEMGQGVHTSLQQMLAEELDVKMESVSIVMGDTELCPWDMGTFGSMTTRFFGPAFRNAGAQARQILIEIAAEKWALPVAQLEARDGWIFDKKDGDRKIAYGALTEGKAVDGKPKGEVRLKTPDQFKIIGKGFARKDATEKVTGKAQYAADIILPGMHYAGILRLPAHGAKLLHVDVSEAQKMPSVKVVREKDFLAVLHPTPDGAAAALEKIKARFSKSPLRTDEKTIFSHLLKVASKPQVVGAKGHLKAHHEDTFEHTYFNDYVAHAPIEPHAAVVHFENGHARVWASTQTPFMVQEQVAKELKIPTKKVRVLPVFLGGGFGGKSSNPQVLEAARCARLSGHPVQVAWSREDEFFCDTYRPAAVVKIRSGLDAKGSVDFWDYEVYYAGDRGSDVFYDFPNYRARSFGSVMERGPNQLLVHPFAVGPWRAPGNNTNTFARESEIDILAERAKIDPVAFRIKQLGSEKFRRVLKTAAEKFGWPTHVGSSGKGIGVACGWDVGTFVAMMAEVEVDKESGHIQVKRVVCAQDMGLVINPRGARAQAEGSVIMGLGYTLREMLHFKNGQIEDVNFGTYELPRFSWLPKIETHFIQDEHSDAEGGGEPSIVTVGAAVANAVFDATGARLYHLPMTPDRVLAAIKARKG